MLTSQHENKNQIHVHWKSSMQVLLTTELPLQSLPQTFSDGVYKSQQNWEWWCTSEAEADGSLEFEASLDYRESSRAARATQRNPFQKKILNRGVI